MSDLAARCRQQMHKEETISEEGIRKLLGGMMRVRLPGNVTDLNTFGFITYVYVYIICMCVDPTTHCRSDSGQPHGRGGGRGILTLLDFVQLCNMR